MDSVNIKPKKFGWNNILALFQMPRMHSSAGQCCLCVVGVFMFLAGVIMIAIGVCLILNYGLFDSKLLPPELQSDDGKRIVGIILTTCGFIASIISVLTSSYYLCTRSKPPTVEPLDLSKIPNTARKSSGERKSTPDHKATKSASTASMHSTHIPQSQIRKAKRKRHKMNLKNSKKRLEGIQEADCISRRQSEIDMMQLRNALEEEQRDTPRSDTVSQDSVSMQQDKNAQEKQKIPDIHLSNAEKGFPKSVNDNESACTIVDDVSVPKYVIVQEDTSSSFTKDDSSSSESGYTDSVTTDKVEFDQQGNSLLD